MERKLSPNYQHFTKVSAHDTKRVHALAIPYGSYDEDTALLILAMIGLTLMLATAIHTCLKFLPNWARPNSRVTRCHLVA